MIPPVVLGTVRADPGLWERYVERAAGPPAFDTARHYGDESEGRLGAFLERHGLRSRTVLIGKGAHTPQCAPEHVGPQLTRSLELLRTDHLDLYLLHRDDPSVPVGAWVEALETEVRAGRVRSIGVSNWSAERYEAFNAEAARAGSPPAGVDGGLRHAERLRNVRDARPALAESGPVEQRAKAGSPCAREPGMCHGPGTCYGPGRCHE